MKQKQNQQRPRSIKRSVFAAAAACVTVTVLAPTLTNAEFSDSTFASTTAAVQTMPAAPPVNSDQSAASALFIDKFGRLFVSGSRTYGDGAGGTATAISAPTQVNVGDAVIREAAGSTENFNFDSQTAYMAVDTDGQVWTWGKPYNDIRNLGRGDSIDLPESYTAGTVDLTAAGTPLPDIIDMERAENQFYGLDATGTMWTWGYQNQNLARSFTGNDYRLPKEANTVTTTHDNRDCTNPATTSTVTWHSIWGGNNGSAAVATDGLIYTWGFDNPSSVTNLSKTDQRCPILNEAANRALFAAYPEYYKDSNGDTYDPGATYDSSSDAREARSDRYKSIVTAMQGNELSVCSDVISKSIVDTSSCPVRQFGYSARAPQMLLQNGDLYTWTIDSGYGQAFLGRDPSNNNSNFWDQPGNVHFPTVVLQNVNYVSQGVSAITAITNSGQTYGWGSNNLCQAIGARPTGTVDCATNSNSTVIEPTLVAGIPADAVITRLGSTQCATWAEAADGRTWAWGAGSAVASNFQNCVTHSAADGGYKIYNTLLATEALPFGEPVSANSTGTIRVR